MPEWLWAILIGGVVLGLLALVWRAQNEKIAALEREVWRLREWRHTKIDSYIPRAVDEHERRLNRLDNGGSH